MAATPVGAATTAVLTVVSRICFRKVVLPVPAFPVRKTHRDVSRINSPAIAATALDDEVSVSESTIQQYNAKLNDGITFLDQEYQLKLRL
jgi:hypothetical protein